MENVISVKNMRESDAFTINTSVDSKELMLRAAQGVYDSVSWKGHIAIVTGSGNNGGDGYALASILQDRGFAPVLLRVSESFSDDGLYYYKECIKKGVGDLVCDSCTDFSQYDIIVDCILGTGFSGVLKQSVAEIIEQINRTDAYVVSVDINSGLNGSNGLAQPIAVRSDLTVSIGYYKTGMFLNDSSYYIKRLVNKDIGIKLLKKQYYLISKEELNHFVGYGSVQLSADDFAREYALNEEEFRTKPIKTVVKESEESKKIFVIDYDGNKLIVDQGYVYFQSNLIESAEDKYTSF
ncbi:MAG: NAD(P)H-hydrate epimerase [Ruminococcus sp.]